MRPPVGRPLGPGDWGLQLQPGGPELGYATGLCRLAGMGSLPGCMMGSVPSLRGVVAH